ncbi:MAG: DNA-directed RNA polymerase subunit alpha [Rickettsiales bacterium]|nr:DNA-directed RNA polymerase subunit alpha [Rickettsiales bacterium]
MEDEKMAVLQENWKDLIFPNSINVENKNGSGTHAVITVEPLERGYGTTLGNSLRRVMLSSIGGFAVTSIKIDTVLHEYSVISGIREDVSDIIMNVKSLIITKSTTSPTTLRLKLNKKGTIYAKDIILSNNFEILNPDLVICNIEDSKINLNVEMVVEYGKGYFLGEKDRRAKSDDVTTIYLDSLFNSVKRVSYTVENTRSGNQIDYDKLILEVETNGTITPEEAIGIAAKIIQKQLDVFINFRLAEASAAIGSDTGDTSVEEAILAEFNKKIDEMELSVRSYNCLISEGVRYIGDLVQKTEADMLKLPNFGKKSLNELKDNLKVLGLNFGMKMEGWKNSTLAESIKKKEKK